MAHLHHLSSSDPTDIIHFAVGQTIEIALWGGGPNGENLDVRANDPSVVRVDHSFPMAGIPGPNTYGEECWIVNPATELDRLGEGDVCRCLCLLYPPSSSFQRARIRCWTGKGWRTHRIDQ